MAGIFTASSAVPTTFKGVIDASNETSTDSRNGAIGAISFGSLAENDESMPPASVQPADCAVFAYNPYELDETYLVWEEGVEEPAVWRYFGADYDYFHNFNHYLEYIVGDRRVDDSVGPNP